MVDTSDNSRRAQEEFAFPLYAISQQHSHHFVLLWLQAKGLLFDAGSQSLEQSLHCVTRGIEGFLARLGLALVGLTLRRGS